MDIDNTRIEELLKFAVVTAVEAGEFYAELLKRVPPGEQRDKLTRIVQQKTKHRATLEGLYVMVTLEKPENLPGRGIVSFSGIDAEGKIEACLATAIALEEKVCRYYHDLSKRTDDQQLKHLLRMLADEEKSLLDILWELTVTGPPQSVVKPRFL